MGGNRTQSDSGYTQMRPQLQSYSENVCKPTKEESDIITYSPRSVPKPRLTRAKTVSEPTAFAPQDTTPEILRRSSLNEVCQRRLTALASRRSLTSPYSESSQSAKRRITTSSKLVEKNFTGFLIISCDESDEDDDDDEATENHSLLPVTPESLFRRERMIPCYGYKEFTPGQVEWH